MSHLVKIKPGGYQFRVKSGETVLDAAIRQEFYFPHSCRYGVCGTCKGKLLSGEIDYDGVEPFGLLPGEEEAGYALFCSAKPKMDLVIEMMEVRGPEELPTRELSCQVSQCRDMGANIYLITLQPTEQASLEYRAGQYLEVIHQDGRASFFSIANSPYAGSYLELHIRHGSNNEETREILALIEAKKTIRIRGPFGHCIFRKETKLPMIFLAEGTGFAAVKAIIEEQMLAGFTTPMHLYWYGKGEADLYLKGLAERWMKHVRHFKFTPLINEDIVTAVVADYPDLSGYQIYAAGSEAMVLDAHARCQEYQINPEHFYSDWVSERD